MLFICYQTTSKHLPDMFGQQPQSLKVLASIRGQPSQSPGPDVPLSRARHVPRA